MFKMNKYGLIFGIMVSTGVMAEGINCATMPEWSEAIDGYQLNQHHVFCGEAGKKDKAKGFHAMIANQIENVRSLLRIEVAEQVL